MSELFFQKLPEEIKFNLQGKLFFQFFTKTTLQKKKNGTDYNLQEIYIITHRFKFFNSYNSLIKQSLSAILRWVRVVELCYFVIGDQKRCKMGWDICDLCILIAKHFRAQV